MATHAASVVMPLRRQNDEWLEQAVRSVLEQDVPTELVVVTAADTPRSNLAVLERLEPTAGGRLAVHRRPRPGFAVALNEGIRRARSDRVGFLFSDDWLAPDAIRTSLSYAADIVSGGKQIWAEREDGEFAPIRDWVGTRQGFEQQATFEAKARYVSHFLLLSRPKVIEAGGIDESLGDLSGVDDFDLIWTLLEKGASVAFNDHPVYLVRDHGGDRLTLRGADEQLVSLRRILDKHDVDPSARAEIERFHTPWYGRTITEVLSEEGGATQGP